ncbi:hypothetical protein [Streptomyces zaomyceticus]|uniref:hypothetical protein n=1 Tax=Streptomyces zaomyceticus TaxID=68286 RepID=UPI0032438A48
MWWRTAQPGSAHSASERSGNSTARVRPGLRQRYGSGRVGGRELEQRVRRLLRSLDVRPPLSVPDLCQALGRSRGRHIELRPYPLPTPGPLGLWFETSAADLIIFQRETTPLHQDHIVLHEVGHMLADHRGPAIAADQWQALLPGLRTGAIKRALQRCTYDTEEEWEAELVATIVGEWASVLDHVTPAESNDDLSARRVQAALGDRQGWL